EKRTSPSVALLVVSTPGRCCLRSGAQLRPKVHWLNYLGISGVRRAAWFLRGFFFATAFRTPGRDNRPPVSQTPKETIPCPPPLQPPAPEEKRNSASIFGLVVSVGIGWDGSSIRPTS